MPFDLAAQTAELQLAGSVLIATVLGGLVGIDRSMAGKHAGMRTYALVALGSCVFTLVSTIAGMELAHFPGINPLQISASIIIGIGFIGTGLAAFRGEQAELTTASGVWVVAAIGMACGYGLYMLAIMTTILCLVVFSLFASLERWLRLHWGA